MQLEYIFKPNSNNQALHTHFTQYNHIVCDMHHMQSDRYRRPSYLRNWDPYTWKDVLNIELSPWNADIFAQR